MVRCVLDTSQWQIIYKQWEWHNLWNPYDKPCVCAKHDIITNGPSPTTTRMKIDNRMIPVQAAPNCHFHRNQ